MKWTERVTDKDKWHRWFAWRPVRLDERIAVYDPYRCRHTYHYQWRWLTHVERQYAGEDSYSIHEYREVQDVPRTS